MPKRIVSGIMFTLLLISMLVLAFNIQPVKASGTVYIRADGSIDPSTAPISSVDNLTYTFTDDINDSIVVDRDNIVVDGAGYTLQGGSGTGITLSKRSNVAIKNITIKAFWQSIWLDNSSFNNSIIGNNITNNYYGIWLRSHSNYNRISGNNITNNYYGIYLDSSSNNSIDGNKITENGWDGIYLDSSPNNSIIGNNITENNGYGIELWISSYNRIVGNSITANKRAGIHLYYSSNNVICRNNFVDNPQQIYIETPGYANVWDDGYPSGGNYWSDHNPPDIYSGPHQNETGSDGIGDSPYAIGENNVDHYPLMKPWTPPDGAIVNITTSKTIVGQGYTLNVTLTINNQGNKIEEFNTTLFADSTPINSQSLLTRSENSRTYTFTWNTTGFAKGNYTIWAYAWPVQDETDTADNNYTDGTVRVTMPGDCTPEYGIVDIFDIAYVAVCFGAEYGKPPPPGTQPYNPNADIIEDKIIDIFDIAAVAVHFGETYQ